MELAMAETHSGGCQCGAIRFRINGPLGHAGICHCRMCQKAFGSWGAALLTVKEPDVTWTRGTPAEFRSSPVVARGFCANCGTQLYMHEDNSGIYDIAIGALDDPEAATPTDQVGIESKLSWFNTLATLPGRSTEQDRTPEALATLTTRQHPDRDTESWPPLTRPPA
jgi:hypothetical protein